MSVFVALLNLGLLLTAIRAEVHNTTAYEYTMSPVLSRNDDYTFTISVPKSTRNPNGPREELTIVSCSDLMPTSEIQAGVILKWISYEEDRVHHCDELDGEKVGYSLVRDPKTHQPIIRAGLFAGY